MMAYETEKEKLDHVELISSQDTGVSSKEDSMGFELEYANETESIDINERKSLRKMDLRIVPFVTILYLLSFLDRGYVCKSHVDRITVILAMLKCLGWQASLGNTT
jgi:hypothetical protein